MTSKMKILSLCVFGFALAIVSSGCGKNTKATTDLVAKLSALNTIDVDAFLDKIAAKCEECPNAMETDSDNVMARPDDSHFYLYGVTIENAPIKSLLAQKEVTVKLRICPNGASDVLATHHEKTVCLNLKESKNYSLDKTKIKNFTPAGFSDDLNGAVYSLPGLEHLYFVHVDKISAGGCFGYSYVRDSHVRVMTEAELVKLEFVKSN